MKIKFFNIGFNELNTFAEYLDNEIAFEIKRNNTHNVILIKEQFYYENSGLQVNMLILNLIENKIQIDILACGGEMPFLFWQNTETKFINEVENKIITFCEKRKINIERIND